MIFRPTKEYNDFLLRKVQYKVKSKNRDRRSVSSTFEGHGKKNKLTSHNESLHTINANQDLNHSELQSTQHPRLNEEYEQFIFNMATTPLGKESS